MADQAAVVLNSQPKLPEGESVAYSGKKAEVVWRLNPEQLRQVEKKFPEPVITAATTPLEAAAHAAYARVFKVLRNEFTTSE